MFYPISFFVFLFGTIIGSFLNVVILRYNTGMSVNGRSQCFSCGKGLRWYELIPVFSYLALRGKCSRCKSKISWQYPLVELTTGLLFVTTFQSLIGVQFGKQLFAFYALIECLLVIITVYDLRHKIIPDGIVYAFILLSLAKLFVSHPFSSFLHFPGLLELLAGPILFLPFFLLWFLSRGTWMGLGDGKLALGMGWMLGLAEGSSAIILGFWLGAVFSVLALVLTKVGLSFRGKRLTMKSEIPFAPFLILGLLLAFFFHPDILSLKLLF